VSVRHETLLELGVLTDQLASARLELAELEAAAHRQRTEAWFNHPSDKISERDRVADFQTLDLAEDIIKLKGEISALEDRRILLRDIIVWTGDD
jgi:hypothetical protein